MIIIFSSQEKHSTDSNQSGAAGATDTAKEPIYTAVAQASKGGVTKPPQSGAPILYANINAIVPKQRVTTQSYDDVLVGAGTTIIGGPAVPPLVPTKGSESKPPPVPKKTKGAPTTQTETKDNDDARNLPHHAKDGK